MANTYYGKFLIAALLCVGFAMLINAQGENKSPLLFSIIYVHIYVCMYVCASEEVWSGDS